MTRPWQVIERVDSDEGPLELRCRGDDDFLITIGGRVLVNADAHRSERALGDLSANAIADRQRPRLLIGGLGMAFTLRGALDALPKGARVVVAELSEAVVGWCRGPLAPLTGAAVDDRRVELQLADVAGVIARAAERGGPARFDAIALDLYEGPPGGRRSADPLFGGDALARTRAALTSGGVLAVWSEAPSAGFEKRLRRAGFDVERHRPGKGGLLHAVYVARVSSEGPKGRSGSTRRRSHPRHSRRS